MTQVTSEPLRPSLITSCSPWYLSELAYDVRRSHGDGISFDLFVPRHGHVLESDVPETTTPTQLMAQPERSRFVAERVVERCRTCRTWERERGRNLGPVRLSAFATYYPDICSRDPGRRLQAILAIQNTFRLGLELRRSRSDDLDLPFVCVEIVCGALLKRFPRDDQIETNPWVAEYRRSTKLEWLWESLRTVFLGNEKSFGIRVPGIRDELEAEGIPYAVALEFEPGAPYVFGLHAADSRVEEDVARYQVEKRELFGEIATGIDQNELSDCVGINLDIAHFRIADVTPFEIRQWGLADRIVHAHICDHPPGMHTRDLPLGTWSPLGPNSCFSDYIRILRERANAATVRSDSAVRRLPFSGTVAIELEGCRNPQWIHRSIPALKSLLSDP